MANTTWSTTDHGPSLTLSNANLTVTSGVTTAAIRSIDRLASASKFYFEITFVTAASSQLAGIAAAGTLLTANVAGMINCCLVGAASGSPIYVNGVATGTSLGSFTANQVAGIAVDLGAQLIWFRNSSAAGNWNNNASANPATGVGGISISPAFGLGIPAYAFAAWVGGTNGNATTANFGDTAFVGSVPGGFTSGFTAGATPPVNVLDTQTLLEQWSGSTPSTQVTSVLLEQWAAVATNNPQVAVTQMALEQWAAVIATGGGAASYRYWGIRATKDNGFYANTAITSGVGFYTGNTPSSYTLALADVTMATSVGGANLCTNTANANATSFANPSNAPSMALVGQAPNKWTSDTGDTLIGERFPVWWYDFGSPVAIVEVSFNNRGGFPPLAFSLVASADASTWVVVQPFGVPAAWSGSTSQTFDVTPLSGSTHYLWGLLVDNGLTNFKQMSDVAFASTAGGANISNNPYLAGSNNTANSSNLPSMAADGNPTGTQWSSAAASGAFRWLYAFTTPQNPAEVRVTVGNTTYAPTSILVQYSDDAVNWTTAKTYTPGAWTVGTPQVIALTGTAASAVQARAMVMA